MNRHLHTRRWIYRELVPEGLPPEEELKARLRAWRRQVLRNEDAWATVRQLFVFVFLSTILLAGYFLQEALLETPLSAHFAAQDFMQVFFLAAGVLAFPVLSWGTLQLGLLAGSEFLRDLYDLQDRDAGWRFLSSALFGGSAGYGRMRHGLFDQKEKVYGDESTPATIGGPGMLEMLNDSGVVLEHGGAFTRVEGAGRIWLKRFETVRQGIDLRPQRRSGSTVGMTRDGIPIKAAFEIEFRVQPEEEPQIVSARLRSANRLIHMVALEWTDQQITAWRSTPAVPDLLRLLYRAIKGSEWLFGSLAGERQEDPEAQPTPGGTTDDQRGLPALPYTFSSDAIYKAVYGNQVQKDGTYSVWADALPFMISGKLRDLLGLYMFDRLMEPEPSAQPAPSAVTRKSARQLLMEDVQREAGILAGFKGAQLLRFHLEPIELNIANDELSKLVRDQRVRAWQADWIRQDSEKMGQSRAKALSLTERARAEAQKQMLVAIAEGLRNHPSGAPPTELVALRFIQALEQIVRTPNTRDYMPTGMLLGELLPRLGVLRESLMPAGIESLPAPATSATPAVAPAESSQGAPQPVSTPAESPQGEPPPAPIPPLTPPAAYTASLPEER